MKLRPKLTDPTYLAYLVVLIISFIVLFLGETFAGSSDNRMFLAFIHHIAASACFVILLFSDKKTRGDLFVLTCLMYFVSCFALNREMEVFRSTTPWFAVYLILTSCSLLLFRFMDELPQWARTATGLFAGLALLAYVYLALFLFPLYPFSTIALIALGFSIHSFVPAMLCYIVCKNFTRHRLWRSGSLGMAAGLLVVIVFSIQYNQKVNELTRIYNRQQVRGEGRLPAWMEAAQQLDNGFVMERVLKTGIVYLEGSRNWDIFSFRIPDRNWDEVTQHDPLVSIASLFSVKARAMPEERVKILEAMYDKRHEGEERLWSGDALHTSYVSTQVKIWPELRLSYTEKALTVTNTDRGAQEAIYTFQLPEGGVVTSLSLWINGREEKAILTTKEKADTAYRTIVGVEVRDPSVVRWQEGNRVSVRVFPVDTRGTRMFRIGVTAPLQVEHNRLRYDNITFKGPALHFTTEDATIELAGKAEGFTPPNGFRRAGNTWEREGNYRGDWHLEMDHQPVVPNTFTFNGQSYSITPYTLKRGPVRTDAVYLDVNAAWSRSEFNEAVKLAGKRSIRVSLDGELINITNDNKNDLFSELQKQRFSLFPLQDIKDPEHALLITKNLPYSPSMQDLEGSRFKEELSAYLKDSSLAKIRLMNIGGNTLSSYLKALKESRVFRYEQGGLLQLKVLLATDTFAEDTESSDRVVIDQSQVAVVKTVADTTQAVTPDANLVQAPDHLMRIFAYNHILRESGKGLITASAGQEQLVNVAREAYVVSPLSSLIVLETQKDYDRFGIKDEGDSLKNASLKSKGAVPEPHEWALIVMAVLSLTWLIYQRKWKPANV